MSLPTSSSHLPPKLPFMDSNLDQTIIDSSLETSTSHTGFGDSASALMLSATPSNVRPLSGKAPTNLLHAASASHKPQGMPRSSSISRVYFATLSKWNSHNSSKLGAASSKFSENSAMTMSKAFGSRNLRLRKRPGLPDFTPPHCERKVFDDGVVVQMIGTAIPPRLVPTTPLRDAQPDMYSFPPVERQIPLLDVEINLDESSFGLNSLSVETIQIRVRSPSLELECPDIMAAFDGSLQTIYHSMDDLPLAGDRAIAVAGSNATTLLSPFESTSQVDVLPSPSPRLSFSLTPKLGPIILSELSSLGEANPSVPTQPPSFSTQTPVTPALSPAFTSVSEEPSPVSTLSVLTGMDEARGSIDTEANIYLNDDSENNALTVLNLDLGDTPTDFMSASESDLYGKSSRWDSLNPSTASMSVANVQSSGHALQKPSFSSSSVLSPLTEADFDASFEEVFRARTDAPPNDDQTILKPEPLSVTEFSRGMAMDHMNTATFSQRAQGTSSLRASLAASLA